MGKIIVHMWDSSIRGIIHRIHLYSSYCIDNLIINNKIIVYLSEIQRVGKTLQYIK